jgi:hypothetical protein
MSNVQEIVSFIDYLKQLYPRFVISDPMVAHWVRVLEPYDRKTLKRAINAHVEESKFSPDLSEIKTLCIRLAGSSPNQKAYNPQDLPPAKLPPSATIIREYNPTTKKTIKRIFPKAYAHPKTHTSKIDFCMDTLGADTVSNLLRSDLKLTLNGVTSLRVDPKQYLTTLNCLVQMAEEKINQRPTPTTHGEQPPLIPADVF